MANAATIREKGSDGIEFTAATPASQPGDVFPAGVILHYAGSAAPTGWLVCDGSVISIATYPNLYAALSTLYGGDGITTFGIPDMRGRVPVGKHSSGTFVTLGAKAGEENHQLTAAEMPSHTHSTPNHTHGVSDPGHGHSITGWDSNLNQGNGNGYAAGSLFVNQIFVAGGSSHATTSSGTGVSVVSGGGSTTGGAGSDGLHNNMPPYIVINFIIRAY